MSQPPHPWAKIISHYDRGHIASGELISKLSLYIEAEAPQDYEPILAALRAHPEEFVRKTVVEHVVRLVEADRKVIDYDAELALLMNWLGCRVEVYGGYAFYDSNQRWLAGRTQHEGTLIDDFKLADNRMPLAVVRVDYDLDLSAMHPSCRGRLFLLSLRYRGDTWESGEGVALAYLYDALPSPDRWHADSQPHEIESHASYRFTGTKPPAT